MNIIHKKINLTILINFPFKALLLLVKLFIFNIQKINKIPEKLISKSMNEQLKKKNHCFHVFVTFI